MSPIVDSIADALAGRAKVAKINVQEALPLANRYRVTAIPWFLVIKAGAVVAQIVGPRSRDELLAAVEEHLD